MIRVRMFMVERTHLDDGEVPTWVMTAASSGVVWIDTRGEVKMSPKDARRFANKILAMADRVEKQKGKK
jgi:hypothetical protein